MFRTLLIGLIGLIALNSVVIADISLGVNVSKAEETTSTLQSSKRKFHKTFKKDDHRYNKRYRDFDYDRYGYYNDDGLYFGYFDRRGYFFNNIYFEYNSRYTYRDRLYRRGGFAPHRHHYRRYRYYDYNDWNRVHHYREPNEVVYGYYYEERYNPPPPRPPRYGDRVYIREEYIGDRRDYRREREEYYGRYRDEYYGERGRYIGRGRDYYRNEHYGDRGRDHYRGGRRHMDKAHVIYHRFSNKKDKRSKR
jgi:hypothetical protein